MKSFLKALCYGFSAFYVLGILLFAMAPMLWLFIRHRLTKHDQRKSKSAHRRGVNAQTGPGDSNNEPR
jgi:hypothetical protein